MIPLPMAGPPAWTVSGDSSVFRETGRVHARARFDFGGKMFVCCKGHGPAGDFSRWQPYFLLRAFVPLRFAVRQALLQFRWD